MVGFQNLKCILLNNFNVCGPTSINLIPHLVSKVRKMQWQNGGQGPIIIGVLSYPSFGGVSVVGSVRINTNIKVLRQSF